MAPTDVVIPTRDTRALTLRCIESVLATDVAADGRLRCIVVDNASSDGTADAIRARWPEVDVIRNELNAGFGEACNQAARRGRGELLLMLNSDVVARPGAVERLVGFLARNESYAAAGGRLVDDGTDRTQVGFTVRAFPRVSAQV